MDLYSIYLYVLRSS